MEAEGKKVTGNGGPGKTASEEAALKKCLEENKGDHAKCKSLIEALKSAVVPPEKRALSPLRLRIGSLTEPLPESAHWETRLVTLADK